MKRKRSLLFLLFTCCCALESTWVVELSVPPEQFAREHKLRYVRPLPFLSPRFHEFASIPGVKAARFEDSPGVWRQEPRAQYKRVNVPDPLYENQWHLHTHPFGVDADFASPNVTGAGVVVGVVDDGLEHAHPEFACSYDVRNSYDYNGRTPDPTPRNVRDGHGTAAAGVVAGCAKNGHCGRGVAPGARVAGIRLIAEPTTDATEAEALTHNAMGGVDIFSCSWGPQDDGATFGETGYLVRIALARYVGALVGRGGKGSIYVWASGNGRDSGDSCAFDAYANSPYVFPVGALDHTGRQSWYSEGCGNLVGVAPSSGANLGIITADLMGNAGYAPGECTSTFGGTSSAAPLAAGIFALILQERPDLTWRDLLHVLSKGATLVEPLDESWQTNGAGVRHSDRFGFGLLKLPPLLAAARAHRLVPPQKVVSLPDQVFPGGRGALPFNYTVRIPPGELRVVEQVTLRVNAQHADRGRIIIEMRSPSGTPAVMAPARPNDHGTDWPADGWLLGTRRFLGEQAGGAWTVTAYDSEGVELRNGGISRIQISLMGY